MRKCEVPGCDRKHQARGLCQLHYQRAVGWSKRNPESRNIQPMKIGELTRAMLDVEEPGQVAVIPSKGYSPLATFTKQIRTARKYMQNPLARWRFIRDRENLIIVKISDADPVDALD